MSRPTIEELLDREAIRHTLVSYNKCGDADDADGYAACFTEDGVINSLVVQQVGRAAIREWKANSTAFTHGPGGKTAPFRIHYLTSSHIEFIDRDHARVRTPWFVVTDIGPDHAGVYNDILRREGDRWLIERREIDTAWRADLSYTGAKSVGEAPA